MACMLRTYKTNNSMVGFSKYEFNNKLLGGITLLKVISSVTWTQPIYMPLCIVLIINIHKYRFYYSHHLEQDCLNKSLGAKHFPYVLVSYDLL